MKKFLFFVSVTLTTTVAFGMERPSKAPRLSYHAQEKLEPLTVEEFENLSPHEQLFYAISTANFDYVKYAFSSGADVNAQNTHGLTALHSAILALDRWQRNPNSGLLEWSTLEAIINYLLIHGASTTTRARIYDSLPPLDPLELTALLFTSYLQSLSELGAGSIEARSRLIYDILRFRSLFQLLFFYHPPFYRLRLQPEAESDSTLHCAIIEMLSFRNFQRYEHPEFIHSPQSYFEKLISVLEHVRFSILLGDEKKAIELISTLETNIIHKISIPLCNSHEEYLDETLCLATLYGQTDLSILLIAYGANPLPALNVVANLLSDDHGVPTTHHEKNKRTEENLKHGLRHLAPALIKKEFLNTFETDNLYLFTLMQPSINEELLLTGESFFSRSRGWTVLHHAADTTAMRIFQHILDTDTNAQTYIESPLRTPLHLAAQCCHPNMVRKLLHRGARYKVDDYEGNALYKAIQYNKPGSLETVRILLEHGAHPDDIIITPTMPLAVLIELLRFGVLAKRPSNDSIGQDKHVTQWSTTKELLKGHPILLAVLTGDTANLNQLLSEKPTRIQLDDAFVVAAVQGSLETVSLLLAHGVSDQAIADALSNIHLILRRCLRLDNFLYWASSQGLTETINLLFNHISNESVLAFLKSPEFTLQLSASNLPIDSYIKIIMMLAARTSPETRSKDLPLYFSLLPRELLPIIIHQMHARIPFLRDRKQSQVFELSEHSEINKGEQKNSPSI
jgi:ankyrin repeat protein